MLNYKKQAEIILKDWETHLNQVISKKETRSLGYFYKNIVNQPKSIQEIMNHYMDGKLFTDKYLVLEICKKGQHLLSYYKITLLNFCSEEIKKDPKVIETLIEINEMNLKFASEELRNNKKFILEKLKNRDVFQYASDKLKDDDDVFNAALKRNNKQILYASDRIRKNEKFMLTLCKQNIDTVKYINPNFRNNAEFLLNVWEFIKKDKFSSNYHLNYQAQKLLNGMGDELKLSFNHIISEQNDNNLKDVLESGLKAIILRKELSGELCTVVQKERKVKI